MSYHIINFIRFLQIDIKKKIVFHLYLTTFIQVITIGA